MNLPYLITWCPSTQCDPCGKNVYGWNTLPTGVTSTYAAWDYSGQTLPADPVFWPFLVDSRDQGHTQDWGGGNVLPVPVAYYAINLPIGIEYATATTTAPSPGTVGQTVVVSANRSSQFDFRYNGSTIFSGTITDTANSYYRTISVAGTPAVQAGSTWHATSFSYSTAVAPDGTPLGQEVNLPCTARTTNVATADGEYWTGATGESNHHFFIKNSNPNVWWEDGWVYIPEKSYDPSVSTLFELYLTYGSGTAQPPTSSVYKTNLYQGGVPYTGPLSLRIRVPLVGVRV